MTTPTSPRPSEGARVPVGVSTEDLSAWGRIRRNPGAWGVALGAAIVLVSLFLVWIEVTNNSTGQSERVRAISSFTGQSLLFAALLAVGAGLAIAMVTSTGWRIAWAIAALALGGLFVAAAGWALVDAEGFTKYAADAQAFTSVTAQSQMQDASDRLTAAFASGTVTAAAQIGAIVGLLGGALAVLGAVLSFARRPLLR
jgi:hypothetical protein